MVKYANTCGPQEEIRPPRCDRNRHGLFSAADVRTVDDGHWSMGIRYRSDACTGNVYAWPRPCPPCGTQTCTTPFSVTVELTTERFDRGCGTYLSLTAQLTAISPGQTPSDAVFTVSSTCGVGDVELDYERTKFTLGTVPYDGTDPSRVTFTVRESVTGTSQTITIAANSSGTVTLEIDPTAPSKKVLDGVGPWLGAEPFHLYSSVHCMPGGGFSEEAKELAVSRMTANEECAVESHLWNSLLTQGAQPVGDVANPKPLPWALGELEAALLAARGSCTGTLHLPAKLAIPMSAASCCLLEQDGAALRTRLGSTVSFGSCYNPRLRPDGETVPDGQVVIVGTGPVVIQRGPISTYEGLDKETNDYAAISERVYAVITDCPLVWTIATP